MYKPYIKPVFKARADIKLLEPKISKVILFPLKMLCRLYLFLFYGIARVVLRGEDHLFGAFKRALAGESRCIIAFRHPNGGEGQLLAWFFLFKLKILAARKKVKFARHPHAVFLYGFEVVRWGGWVSRLILPRVGAMPIYHSRMDRQGMARIYKAITEGPYPLALAPEGQVSYTAESVPRLEQGAFRIGFNAAERMSNQGSNIPVEILPLSIHFRFGSWGKLTLKSLIKKIEKYTNCHSKEAKDLLFTQRLDRCREHILEVNEKQYHINSDKSIPFEQRLDTVINRALETGERIIGVKSEGDLFTRLNSLRQICWDMIVLPGVNTLKNLSLVERNTLDHQTGIAWYASRHLEFIHFAWYFRIPLPKEDDPLHLKVEYCQNLYDFASRTMGGAYENRINILPRRVIIQAAAPINLTDRLPSYKKDKKAAINTVMEDLEKVYQHCIDEVNNGV